MAVRPAAAAVRPFQMSLLLFAVTAFIYLLSGKTFFGYDGEIMYRVSESIALRHSLQIVDPIYHANQPYGAYGIGLSLLMVPLVALGAAVFHDPRVLVTLLEPALTAGTVVALNLLLVELGCSWRRALLISFAYAFGTLAWHYSSVLFTEPLIALCLVAATLCLLQYRRLGQRRRLLIAGVAIAIAIMARWDSVPLVAAPLATYGLIVALRRLHSNRERALDLAMLAIPIGLAIAIDLGYDVLRFGVPLGGPYRSDPLGFSTPLFKGLFGLWLSPGVGLFVYTPILLMGAVAFRWFYQRWPVEAILILALFAIRSVFYARYWAWEGGATWGPRFLVPMIPLLLVPTAFIPRERRFELVAIALAILGFLIQLLGQLVPYGLYYGTVTPALMEQLGYCHACLPYPGAQSEAVNAITDFDLRYVPLVVQFRYLLDGVAVPAWGPIAFALPFLLAGVGVVGLRMRRLARQLDLQLAA